MKPVNGSTDDLPSWCWLWGPLIVAAVLAVVPHIDTDWYKVWITGERHGVLEAAQVLLALAGLVQGLRIIALPALQSRPWLYLWVGFSAAACFYIAGEEASWGQHLLQWQTPEAWMALNDQGETNLHNTSSWFDQKPRALLELGVIVGGIVIPLWALCYPALRRRWYGVVLPPMVCLPSAVLAEVTRTQERIVELLGGEGLRLFGRSSEVQEFYFYLFVLLYLIVLGRRLRRD